ncbi:MAG: nuclear transport factor 2 family protein [Steroidobacteraceae bacterium]|jgi:hypothetical protein|nr:nuclear transport factor 2 family protein [Steroidobacteraceae bacterium]
MEKNRRPVASAPDAPALTGKEPGGVASELTQLKRQVADMLDREAIRQLPISYAHFARTKNVDALVALYAKDATFDVPENMGTQAGLRSGVEAIRESLRADLQRADPWPFIHSHYFEMRGKDRAEGFVHIELRMSVQGLQVSYISCYRDEYVRENGAWKFRSRKLCAVPPPC